MRTICAWCATPIETTCDHCGGRLLPATQVGSSFESDVYVCVNGETLITYTRAAIQRMAVQHGICCGCLDLPEEKREALLIDRPPAERPSATLRARLLQEIDRIIQNDAATRRAARQRRIDHLPHEKKRGPTPTRNEAEASREPTDAKQN